MNEALTPAQVLPTFSPTADIAASSFLATYQEISIILLIIGVFFVVLMGFYRLHDTFHKIDDEIIGTYNKHFDPRHKRKYSNAKKYQLVSIGLIVLGILPWILQVMVLNPPV